MGLKKKPVSLQLFKCIKSNKTINTCQYLGHCLHKYYKCLQNDSPVVSGRQIAGPSKIDTFGQIYVYCLAATWPSGLRRSFQVRVFGRGDFLQGISRKFENSWRTNNIVCLHKNRDPHCCHSLFASLDGCCSLRSRVLIWRDVIAAKKKNDVSIGLTTVGFEPTPEDQCLKLAP